MTVAFIPAKYTSIRLPGKNMLALNGHPLLAYAIQSAKDSGIFDEIYVSSDSNTSLGVARKYGATGIYCNTAKTHKPDSHDSAWIGHALKHVGLKHCDTYAVVRVTNPFRTGETIKKAMETFHTEQLPLKSVTYKMGILEKTWRKYEWNCVAEPAHILDYHNLPSQKCDARTYVQNGSIYINKAPSTSWPNTISIYITEGYEGFDINTPEDWILAQELYKLGMAKLPEIKGG